MNINEIRMTAANAGSSPINISGSDLLTILNSIPAPASGSQWDDVTGGINYADGNVGINNAAPTVALDVVGISNDKTSSFRNPDNNGCYFANIDDANLYGLYDAYTDALIIGNNNDNQTIYLNNPSSDIKISLDKTNTILTLKATHFNYIGLQDFADNAAAITGGLSTGDLYYTNSSESAILKIVV